jgi:hypothetical protein
MFVVLVAGAYAIDVAPFWKALMLFAIFVALNTLAARWLNRDWHKELAHRFRSAQQSARLPKGNYLFIRGIGDEAANGLITLQFFTMLGSLAAQVIADATARSFLNRPRATLAGFVFLFFIVPSALLIWMDLIDMRAAPTLTSIPTAVWLLLVATAAISLAAILVGAVLIMFLLAQAICVRSFGWADLFGGLLMDFAVEPTPIGVSRFVNVDWRLRDEFSGLEHSTTYSDPEALRHLAMWVVELIGEPTS